MKKVFRVLLTSIALFSLASCVDSNGNSSSGNELSSSSILPQEVYYHVIFVNDDETKLYEADVLEGTEAVYGGKTPTKEADEEFTYEFDGWDKELTNIQSDTTFVAQFKAVAKQNWGPIVFSI